MHDYPPLVSGALQLLFRHFSQRQEVLQAFKQVCVCLCVCVVIPPLNVCAAAKNSPFVQLMDYIHVRFNCLLPAKMLTTTSR